MKDNRRGECSGGHVTTNAFMTSDLSNLSNPVSSRTQDAAPQLHRHPDHHLTSTTSVHVHVLDKESILEMLNNYRIQNINVLFCWWCSAEDEQEESLWGLRQCWQENSAEHWWRCEDRCYSIRSSAAVIYMKKHRHNIPQDLSPDKHPVESYLNEPALRPKSTGSIRSHVPLSTRVVSCSRCG